MQYHKVEYVGRSRSGRYVHSFLFGCKSNPETPSEDWPDFIAKCVAWYKESEYIAGTAEVEPVIVTAENGRFFAEGKEVTWSIHAMDDEGALIVMPKEEIIPNG